MKKSYVFLLLALAIIVLVSPRIVGRLAERSLDENLDWAATESDEFTVTSQGFDRGWFSSEGQHRVEINDGDLRDSLLGLAYEGGLSDLPVLIIDTHIDHGLVPVSSFGREKGSLAPGLGSAVSTLSLEFKNGETVSLPGTVYSKVGLGGNLESNLVVEPGSFEVDSETAHWGNVDVRMTTSPSANVVGFSGSIDDLQFVSASNEVGVTNISFDGEQQKTRFGFAVGDVELSVETISFPSEWGKAETGPLRITSTASVDDDLVSGGTTIDIDYVPLGEIGPTGVRIDLSIENVDAAAIASLSRTIDAFESYGSGDGLMVAAEDDLQKLLAAGFSLRLDTLELATPQGKISATLDVDVSPTDMDQFVMTSVLLALDARLNLSLPVEFYDYLVSLDPQVASAAALGFLRLEGDQYEMEAEFKSGLLTINGAPMPVPLPGGN